VWLEGLGELKKKPMTSLGIEPATFGLLAQCLNQLRYRVPSYNNNNNNNSNKITVFWRLLSQVAAIENKSELQQQQQQ
jgi:hypothetical protein